MAKTVKEPKIKELSFSIKKDSLSKLIETLKDLSRLNDKVLFKIDKENTLIYTLVGTGQSVNAFKNFIFKTNDLFYGIGEFDDTINYIVKSAKLMFRTLQIISSFDIDVTGNIYFDNMGDLVFSDRIYIKAGTKLRQNFYGGDPSSMNINITIDTIKEFIDVDNANFDFDLSGDDFDKLKKLASSDDVINIFYLNTFERDGSNHVSIGEGTWDITVSETSWSTPTSLAFPKKYFKTINIVNGNAKVYVFDESLLVVSENSNLLISIEISA